MQDSKQDNLKYKKLCDAFPHLIPQGFAYQHYRKCYNYPCSDGYFSIVENLLYRSHPCTSLPYMISVFYFILLLFSRELMIQHNYLLGHVSASFTLDTYAHVTTTAQKEAAQTTGNILGN